MDVKKNHCGIEQTLNPASKNRATPAAFPPRLLFREPLADYAIRDALLRHSAVVRGRVLDIGCGNRRYHHLFGTQVESWLGIDWPNTAHGGHSLPNVIGSALALPLRESVFDTIICTQVLEHVSEPLQLLEEAGRVLRPGGSLLLTAPQYNALHEEPRDFFRYTRYGLEHLARKAGLQTESVAPIGGFITLFAFIMTLHFAPLRIPGVLGLWQWSAWHFDKTFNRPKDCMGYVLVASKPKAVAGLAKVAA